ncbi:MAG: hypothetical protein OEY78_00315 [Gammaproteobacteria bacterium]|nr:hypothetical protein [Gammaproteobacteria bacterium]
MKKIVFLSMLSLTFMTGCHVHGGGLIIDNGYGHQPMPPAHAPAHGRRLHRYYYYPNAEIYFDVGRNMYFYLDSHGAWSFSVNLPVHLRSHIHHGYVEVEMEHERPYLRHKYYKNKYKKHKRYNRKYKNGRKYRDDRILRQGSDINDREYRNERNYDEREYRDEREYKNERSKKYKENKMRKKEEKYEKNNSNMRDKKNRRNDLY